MWHQEGWVGPGEITMLQLRLNQRGDNSEGRRKYAAPVLQYSNILSTESCIKSWINVWCDDDWGHRWPRVSVVSNYSEMFTFRPRELMLDNEHINSQVHLHQEDICIIKIVRRLLWPHGDIYNCCVGYLCLRMTNLITARGPRLWESSSLVPLTSPS